MLHIKEEKCIYDNHFVIDEAVIAHTDNHGNTATFKRMKLQRQDAAVVFVYNTESRKVILTRQFRYAIAAKTKAPILEIVAGKVDGEEEPVQTAFREVEEEVGYRVKKENMQFICSFFASPGYSSEKFHFYHATVKNEDKGSRGGGLKQENEYIEIVEMDYNAFIQLVDENQIEDAKTLIAALHIKLHNNYQL